MWLFRNLIKTAVDTAIVLPISIVSDVVTLWWQLNDTEPKTWEAIKDIIDDLDNIV